MKPNPIVTLGCFSVDLRELESVVAEFCGGLYLTFKSSNSLTFSDLWLDGKRDEIKSKLVALWVGYAGYTESNEPKEETTE